MSTGNATGLQAMEQGLSEAGPSGAPAANLSDAPAVIDIDALSFVGSGLRRPECVVAHSSGLLFTPDWTEPGGVSAIAPNGGVKRILATDPAADVETPVRPNGIALEAGGSFLLAHLGAEHGGVYRLFPDGRCQLVVDRVDGERTPPVNFVAPDAKGRLWFTVSTRVRPRADDYRPGADSGFIAVLEPGLTEARIVADGLGYANECLFSPDGATMWVNETFARRLIAFDVVEQESGVALHNRRTVAQFGVGVFPDGLAMTADGALLVVSIISNRVIKINPDASPHILLQDADVRHLEDVEKAFQMGEMGRPHLDASPAKRLRNISNIAFGGPELRTAYLGCLLGDAIATFDAPFKGEPLSSWDVDLGPLAV